MEVIEHKKGTWFFLRKGESFFLDVNCTYSFSSFSVLIELNESETRQYLELGIDFIEELAEDVSNRAMKDYGKRNIQGEIQKLVHAAIMKYNAQRN